MNDFGINEMLEMQKALQEKYKDKWEGISPEIGKNKFTLDGWRNRRSDRCYKKEW